MRLFIHKTSRLEGVITLSGSKSHAIRSLLLASIAKGKSILSNVPVIKDLEQAIDVVQSLGAKIKILERNVLKNSMTLEIDGPGLPLPIHIKQINSGNSGITTRFVLPFLGLRKYPKNLLEIEIGEQMRDRPIKPLLEAMNELGMQLDIKGQIQFPLAISGVLRGGQTKVDGSTSQYLSALLMALPCAAEDSCIFVNKLNERPYIDMTLESLNEHRIHYQHERQESFDRFIIEGGQSYKSMEKNIPGDFSSASCILVAAALLPGEVTLNGFDLDDVQGDKVMIDILKKMGADIQITNDSLKICGGKPLKGITIDCNSTPDLLPALAVLGTQSEGQTRLINVEQARIKETDRIHSMVDGLRAIGGDIEEKKDGLVINKSLLKGSSVHGYHDHRTIMALAVAGMFAEGETVIDSSEGIQKTFPNYIRLMKTLGAQMHLEPIVLIGFKSAGKSTLGLALAQQMQCHFIDLDELIETTHGENHELISCHDIYKIEGEVYFRNLEAQMLQQVLEKEEPIILAVGGGAPMNESNYDLLKTCRCIHVAVPFEKAYERIQNSGLPTFINVENEAHQQLKKLYLQRQNVYLQLAMHTVDNSQILHQSLKDLTGLIPQL